MFDTDKIAEILSELSDTLTSKEISADDMMHVIALLAGSMFGAIICAAHMYVGFHPTLYYAVPTALESYHHTIISFLRVWCSKSAPKVRQNIG